MTDAATSAELTTERLRLRPWRLDEFETFHALTASDEMRRFLGPEPPSREDSFNRMMRNAGCWQLLGWGPFATIERATGEIVGGCGLFRALRELGPDFDPYPEAGWVIDRTRWGRGYATEAMRAVLDWFDSERGGGRTVAIISVGHPASERVAAKLGYAPIGEAVHKGDRVMRYARD